MSTTTTTTRAPATHAAADARTMVRRSLLRLRRYPSLTLLLIGMPLVFLLMFVYVFGGAVGSGALPGAAGDSRADYLAYLVPGILAMTVAAVAQGTAVTVAMDMTSGIASRFRAMDISRVAVLSGHVGGAVAQTALALAVLVGTSLALGYRPDAGLLAWLGAGAVLGAFTLALTWLTVAMGMSADSVETASNTPMVLTLLPFFGSGFVPTDTLPGWLQGFAEHQPFTPVIETTRSLLGGSGFGDEVWWALGWSAVIGLLGYAWARRLYEREPRKG